MSAAQDLAQVWEDPSRNLSLQHHTAAAATDFYRHTEVISLCAQCTEMMWCNMGQSSEVHMHCIASHITYSPCWQSLPSGAVSNQDNWQKVIVSADNQSYPDALLRV